MFACLLVVCALAALWSDVFSGAQPALHFSPLDERVDGIVGHEPALARVRIGDRLDSRGLSRSEYNEAMSGSFAHAVRYRLIEDRTGKRYSVVASPVPKPPPTRATLAQVVAYDGPH